MWLSRTILDGRKNDCDLLTSSELELRSKSLEN